MSTLPKNTGATDRLSQLSNIFEQTSRVLAILGVTAMLGGVLIEVFGRSLFGVATIWVTEVSSYLVVAITFLGAAFVASRDAHIRVDIITSRLSVGLSTIIQSATTWVSIAVSLLVLWKTQAFLTENFVSDARSWSLLNAPLWIPQSTVCIGVLMLVLSLCLKVGNEQNHNIYFKILAYFPILISIGFILLDGMEQIQTTLQLSQVVILVMGLVSVSTLLVSGPKVFITFILLLIPVIAFFTFTSSSSLPFQSLALIACLFFLLLTGLPVTFALFLVGISAMYFWLPPVTFSYIGERAWGAINTFELAAIPMFVLMGAILVRSNASTDMFMAAKNALGRLRGGLAHASIFASGIFAAVSGSSLATAATMGRVAGPEMIKEGYRPELAYGVLAAGGTLGILIPPSIAMIVYGPLAGVPVTDLFLAGIIPGLLMIFAFVLVIAIWTLIDPKAAPTGHAVSWPDKIRSLKGVGPFLLLMLMILGSLYMGFATPTEAGAVGVLGAILISAFRRTFTFSGLIAALEEAALVTSFLLMIAVGASVMGFAVDFLAMPQNLVQFVNSLNLSSLALFVAIIVLYLILGMFVEPISMVLMTLPVVLPVIAAAGWDPLWFGIVLVMLVEIGLITPPVGMILYVLSGVSNGKVSLGQISIGTLPFIFAFISMIFLFFAFPALVTFLPEIAK